ncbi:MAG TPA: glycosyltransferase [Ktedonobacterales bacterium]|nr:glycosyltransferase [Ktedonobacterales bacterium]
MRILFTFEGGAGHFNPLVPIARAAKAAGHTVAFACAPQRFAMVESAGFRAFAAGIDIGSTPETAAMEDHYLATPVIAEREAYLLREGFAGWYARAKVADVVSLCADWQPALLVRDEIDFGSAVAAERLGVPHANVLVIAAGSFVRRDLVVDQLNALRALHRLSPDPDLAMLSRYLVLSPFPPSYRDPAFPLPATAHTLRPLLPGPTDADHLPPWTASLSEAPTVYFSLGTAFASGLRDIFVRVIAGLRDLPINLIVTVGNRLAPADLGDQPPNVRIERYIPQSLILPLCDLVISHGGSGSVMGALAHGLPLALIPLNADQPLNADRCVALGVGRILGDERVTPATVRATIAAMLADPAYRHNAAPLRDEIAGLPGPEYAVDLLERLAAERQPLS